MATQTDTSPQARVQRDLTRIRVIEAELADAREAFEDTLLDLWQNHDLSYRQLGELSGFGKQYMSNLVHAARDRKDS